MNFSDTESIASSLAAEEIVKKFNKLMQIEEYIEKYSSSDEEPTGRINVKIEEDENLVGPESSYTRIDTTGFMTKEEEENDEYYNPNSDRYFGVSDDGYPGVPQVEIPGMLHARRTRRRRRPTNRNTRVRNPEYIPRNDPRDWDNRILNLDCQRHPENEIDGWTRQMQLIVQTNNDKFTSLEILEAYLEYHMSGNVRRWWNSTAVSYREILRTEASSQTNPNAAYIDLISRLLVNEFVGVTELNNREAAKNAEEQKAKYILENIQVCNICYWKNFTCEFEKWFYKLNATDQASYASRYYNKLPPVWAQEMNSKWPNKPAYITDGLAGRIRFLQETIEEKCKTTSLNTSLGGFNNKPCCDPAMIDIPNKWGCSRTSSKPRRSFRRHKKRYRKHVPKIRRYRKNYSRKKPRTFFRKRRPNKRDTCPKGKATCKCWLCQEEGHYANECPNKKKPENKEKNKKLEAIFKINYEPVESDYSDNDSLYEVKIEYEYTNGYETPGTDWEECSSEESDWDE